MSLKLIADAPIGSEPAAVLTSEERTIMNIAHSNGMTVRELASHVLRGLPMKNVGVARVRQLRQAML